VASYFQRAEPVVLSHCPLCSGLDGWGLSRLGELFGGSALPVHVTPRNVRSVNRVYGKGLGEGGITEMTIEELARRSNASPGRPTGTASTDVAAPSDAGHLYLQVLLAWARGGRVERRAELQAELDRIDWAWLREACDAAGEGGFEACQLWCSPRGGVSTPLHYDGSSNFIAQLRGRKRVTLFHPRHAFGLYPYPVGHPMDNYSMVADSADVDLRRFPAAERVEGLETVLEPGDVLWLPAYWWHHVRQPAEGDESCGDTSFGIKTGHSGHGPQRLTPAPDTPLQQTRASENVSLNFWLARDRPLEHYEWLSTRGVASPLRVAKFWGPAAPAEMAAVFGAAQQVPPYGIGSAGSVSVLGAVQQVPPCGIGAAGSMSTSPGNYADAAQQVPHYGIGAAGSVSVEDKRPLSQLSSKRFEEKCRTVSTLPGDSADAVRWLHAARMAEHAAAITCGCPLLGGRLLGAMAAGADAGWAEGTAARSFAQRLRDAIADVIQGGDREVTALLAATISGGRLYPGLVPPLGGAVVSAERGEVSSGGLLGADAK